MLNNLPVEVSSFIGREEDIARGVALLSETRLLTLTGAGGCGKTRLARRIAAQVLHRFPAGVWWAELAALADESLIGDTAANTVGARVPPGGEPVEALAGHFGAGPALLVVDNCEHLITATAAFVDRLLRSTAAVVVLTTSREALAIEGEVTWRVPSLGLPPTRLRPDERSSGALEQYDAVRLFIDRAIQSRPGFRVSNQNAPAVAQICERLDGIPLAIELAAARVRALPPERIAAELDDRFRLLVGHRRTAVPRQRTLLASVDWSHELLEPAERVLFRRLGVFAGGFTLDAAETVVSGEPLSSMEVLDGLTRLVDKSLVQLDETYPAEDRYRLLETIRQYALDRLDEAGEITERRDRHLDWALSFVESIEAEITDAHTAALDRVDSDHANIRAALEWASTSGRSEAAVRLAGAMSFFWAQRGHYREAASWESRLLYGGVPADCVGDGPIARARWGFAYIRFYGGDAAGAYEQAGAALQQAQTAGDESTAARCLHTLSTVLIMTDPRACREGLTEAVALARRAGDEWCLADALQIIAYALLLEGDHRSADRFLAEAFEICNRRANQFQLAWHHGGVGWACTLRSELPRAEAEARHALRLAREIGDPTVEVFAFNLLNMTLLAAGRPADLAADAEQLLADKRERGAFEALIPTFAIRARLAEDPAAVATGLQATAAALIDAGDMVDGSMLRCDAARAALEAGRPEQAAQLARLAEQAAPTDLIRSTAILARGVAARALGAPEAVDFVHDALGQLQEIGVCLGVPLALESLGGMLVTTGQPVEGTRLLAAAATARDHTGQGRLPAEDQRFACDVEAARTALPADEWRNSWDEGSALTYQEAITYARRTRGQRQRPTIGWASLTPTELQVVELAAQGLTNPEIGKRLLMGRGTVKTHLSHIFAKLDVRTRAQLASLASRHSEANGNSPAPV